MTYILIGGLARVLEGSDELTRGLDLTPSTRPENLRRLEVALSSLDARPSDGRTLSLDELATTPRLALESEHGEINVVPVPEGTRGYDDLRRAVRHEPIGTAGSRLRGHSGSGFRLDPMRAAAVAIGFLVGVAYSVTYFVLAFASDATTWWWWFVPIYGTFRIFQASVLLGMAHVGVLPLFVLAGLAIEWGESNGAGRRGTWAASASDETVARKVSVRNEGVAPPPIPGLPDARTTDAFVRIQPRWEELWRERGEQPVEGKLLEAIEQRIKRLDWRSGDLIEQALAGGGGLGIEQGAVGLLLTRIAFGGYLWREAERDVGLVLDPQPVQQVDFALHFSREQPSSRDQRGEELAVTAAFWAMEGLAAPLTIEGGLQEPLVLAAIHVATTVQRESGWDVGVPWPSRDDAFLYGYVLSEAGAEVQELNRSRREPVLLRVELGSPDGVETVTERIWGATICPVCFAVHGLLEIQGRGRASYEQRCRCQVDVEPQERWPSFDFNTYLELCRCCAIEPLKSGSRWSPFFCRECRDRVVTFNRRHRRWVIPIGRHSMMHGDLLSGDEAAIEEHAEHFALRVRGLSTAIDHLDTWTSERVKQNLETLGCAAGQEIDLAWYLTAARQRPLEKQAAFHSLREHFIRPADLDG